MDFESFAVTPEQENERLDKYISELYPKKSRSYFQKLIKSDLITVNDKPQKAGYTVKEGDLITIRFPDDQELNVLPEDIPLDILYEDNSVIIVNKPKNMVVHPSAGHYTGTLVNAILYHCKDSLSGINGKIRPGIVHRIDMNTTGSLIICKTDTAHNLIADQIKEHSVNRIYVGIVCGCLKDDTGTIEGAIGRSPKDRKKMAIVERGGKPAVTHYRVIERFPQYTYVEFKLETGRTHQIRVHMASIGHPLLGDELYGSSACNHRFKDLEGQCLHAKTIGFIHPESNEYMEFSAPIPDYLNELLKKLPNIK